MDWPAKNGPLVSSVFVTDMSADGPALPPLPLLSVLLAVFGSVSAPLAEAMLSNAPAATIVAVRLIVAMPGNGRFAIVHGSATHAPVTLVIDRFDGASVTLTAVAGAGPPLVMTIV
jgi:hypothetical protein